MNRKQVKRLLAKRGPRMGQRWSVGRGLDVVVVGKSGMTRDVKVANEWFALPLSAFVRKTRTMTKFKGDPISEICRLQKTLVEEAYRGDTLSCHRGKPYFYKRRTPASIRRMK